MNNPAHDLTPRQVNLGMTFIDRASLTPGYRLMMSSNRYRAMIALVRAAIDDELVGADYGMQDLIAVRRYFVAKRDGFIAEGR